MRIVRNRWRDLSIAKKLYFTVGIMAVLIACELAILSFAMDISSAVRAFVSGEGVWSKAQKNATFSLQRYITSHDEREYQAFLRYLEVPEGDRRARIELLKPRPDLAKVREGFLQGRIHPDDIDPMVRLLRNFYWIEYLDKAIRIWSEADEGFLEMKAVAADYHQAVVANVHDSRRVVDLQTRLRVLNERLTVLEEDFSRVLGEGSRWLEHLLLSLLLFAVLIVESAGLSLAFLTSRSIARGLSHLNRAADRIGRGDYEYPVALPSRDEIGVLSGAIGEMGRKLSLSYRDLEARVEERTVELKNLAEQNARLYAEARDALQIRDDFLSIASHELKTPLTSLHIQLQLLQRHLDHSLESSEDPDPRSMSKTVAASLKQSQRLNRLIEELLDVTRLRLGRLDLRKERFSLLSVAREAVDQMKGQAQRAGCLLRLEGDEDAFVRADPTRVYQVVSNLLSNAFKYGVGEPVEIRVGVVDRRAVLRVRDYGIGVPEGAQERIFERFERLPTNPGVGGLGLGLYISRQIVEAHGGRIGVAAVDGGGSAFTVEFDLAPVVAVESSLPA